MNNRFICHDGFIKEISSDDLRECAVVHDRKQAITILENINRIFEDYLSKAGLDGIEDYHQYFEVSYKKRWNSGAFVYEI